MSHLQLACWTPLSGLKACERGAHAAARLVSGCTCGCKAGCAQVQSLPHQLGNGGEGRRVAGSIADQKVLVHRDDLNFVVGRLRMLLFVLLVTANRRATGSRRCHDQGRCGHMLCVASAPAVQPKDSCNTSPADPLSAQLSVSGSQWHCGTFATSGDVHMRTFTLHRSSQVHLFVGLPQQTPLACKQRSCRNVIQQVH
jgi:hypothetical protein